MVHDQGAHNSINYTLERVQDEQILKNEWIPVFEQIFTDPADREPPEMLLERMLNSESEKFFLLRDEKGNPAGIELAEILPSAEKASSKAMYVPWTGVLPPYRDMGIGAQMNRRISDHMRDESGVTHTLIDIEDPERLHKSSYSEEELPEATANAVRRINFWRRQDFFVIDDSSKKPGEKLEYVRPGSEDDQYVQGYDHMTVRFSDENLKNEVLSPDKTRVRKSFARESYLDMSRIQYGNLPELELRSQYPAIDKYLRDIDKEPGVWLSLRSEEIRAKTTPVANVNIHILSEEALSPTAPKSQIDSTTGIKNAFIGLGLLATVVVGDEVANDGKVRKLLTEHAAKVLNVKPAAALEIPKSLPAVLPGPDMS
ncbi:MAG: hypothetical protein IT559_06570 [Alphaproteobacteria bacterium]|nr:hypothetical protein [Alphaproteobacteria bacterium]